MAFIVGSLSNLMVVMLPVCDIDMVLYMVMFLVSKFLGFWVSMGKARFWVSMFEIV